MNRQPGTHLDQLEDLVTRRPGLECCANMTARARSIEIGTRDVDRHADQLDLFRGQNAVGPGVRRGPLVLLSPTGIPCAKLRQGGIESTRCGHRVLLVRSERAARRLMT